MSSVNQLESRANEIISFLKSLDLDRTDISIAIFNIKESMQKMLFEFSKDYPNEELLTSYKRALEKDAIYGEYVASQYDNQMRIVYSYRMSIDTITQKYRSLILKSPLSKGDSEFIELLATYQFLLGLRDKATHLIFELTDEEKTRFEGCQSFISKQAS